MKRYRNPQREVARRLIKAVGINGALHYARQNQWEGIVTQILNLHALAGITSASIPSASRIHIPPKST